MGQAERLAGNKDSGDHSSGGSGSECDGIILLGTTTKLVLAPACKGTNSAGLEGATRRRKLLAGTLTCLRDAQTNRCPLTGACEGHFRVIAVYRQLDRTGPTSEWGVDTLGNAVRPASVGNR